MTFSAKKSRVIFLDLIRAFAVLMMVQGHTVDVLLADYYRDLENIFYSAWQFNRGMTAPLFLFTSGITFTYLFRLHREPFLKNPRFIKGVKRAALLIFLGYLLRYPTNTIVIFDEVTEYQWRVFFTVDVLHLIGFGLLFLLLILFIAEKTKQRDWVIFTAFIVTNLTLHPFFENIEWSSFMHPAFAGYFYRKSGSNFPLFPWLSYVFAGGMLGGYLAQHPEVFKTFKFTYRTFLIGVSLIAISMLGLLFERLVIGTDTFWTTSPMLTLLRFGIVMLIISAFVFAARKMETIPRIVILLGRNTLLIYVVHLVILYGSPWNLGVIAIANHSFTLLNTFLTVILMWSLMIVMVYLLNRFQIRNKPIDAA